ncbi:3-keto-disaccharide hydrolase [Arcticibacter tournemirensis]|uniref:DUF1080 domain-containing protein n=1 Tax=Arcticibacter tournemirensis TaxID=699437 RepID=A0A4Q0M9K7_9SPHI|nr:DUF1080 domain-containing protein [Arcticibacter tournemirensis]RXF69643.1 DUF1080 domain-containing protein [Arcticibacter tournemirensis]
MKSFILPALAVTALLACQSFKNTTSMENTGTATAKQGWTPLFDGKTTAGWHTYGKNQASSAWKAEDGALHLDPAAKKQGAEGGDLVTDEEYDNFHLKLEWKIAPNGNSGIIFFVKEDPSQFHQTYNTGLEMQVLDNNGHPDAKIHKHRAGDLYDLIASSKETVKPAGEWNKAEIVSKNGKLDLYLNGTKIVSTTLWDDNWKKMVAGSKFASMPGFGTFKSGKIALQDHGDEVWYRNIVIKKL